MLIPTLSAIIRQPCFVNVHTMYFTQDVAQCLKHWPAFFWQQFRQVVVFEDAALHIVHQVEWCSDNAVNTQRHTDVHTHTHECTHAHTHAHKHREAHTHTHTHTCMHTHTHTHARTYTCTQTHRHTHTHTHACTHRHTHTHTRTHTQYNNQIKPYRSEAVCYNYLYLAYTNIYNQLSSSATLPTLNATWPAE